MDAAEGAPRADKGLIAVGDKCANCLCNRLVGIGGKISLALGKLLGKSGILPGERAVDVEEADVAMFFGGVGGMGRRGGACEPRLETHDLVKMLFNAGNGDADNHLSGFAGNDEALGARCDK